MQTGLLQALLDFHLHAGTRVLEVGCGTANHLQALYSETGCAAWGVDPSLGMLRQSQDTPPRSVIGPLYLSVGVAEALPYPDASFDLIFNIDVAHHLSDLDAAFAEMARLLRPDGVLLTATDSENTIRKRDVLSAYFPETIVHELSRYPSIASLASAHARSGLEIVTTFVAQHPYVLTDVRPFRERAYSCLHLIGDDALAAGVARLKVNLPLKAVSRNFVMVARKQI